MTTKLGVVATAFVLALSGGAMAYASNGADDPVGDDHGVHLEAGDDGGQHHHHHRHHHRGGDDRRHGGDDDAVGGGGADDGPNHT